MGKQRASERIKEVAREVRGYAFRAASTLDGTAKATNPEIRRAATTARTLVDNGAKRLAEGMGWGCNPTEAALMEKARKALEEVTWRVEALEEAFNEIDKRRKRVSGD